MIYRLCLRFMLSVLLIEDSCKGSRRYEEDSPANTAKPTIEYLNLYLQSLKNVVRLVTKIPKLCDINYAFGIFMSNVNLKLILDSHIDNLEPDTVDTIRDIVKMNGDVMQLFNVQMEQDTGVYAESERMYYTLFTNESAWMKRMVHYDDTIMGWTRRYTKEALDRAYKSWNLYWRYINRWDLMTPNSNQTADCLQALAMNPNYETTDHTEVQCDAPESCIGVIVNGTNIGFALCQRLLLLTLARHGRGCEWVSTASDQILINHLCDLAFAEAEFGAMYDYQQIDIFVEQLTSCALEGRVEFMRERWVNEVMQHQLPNGCFGLSSMFPEQKHEEFCDGHLTGLSTAIIAMAVRFIVDDSVLQKSNYTEYRPMLPDLEEEIEEMVNATLPTEVF